MYTFNYLLKHPTAKTEEVIVNIRELTRNFKQNRTILQRNQAKKVKINKTSLVLQFEQTDEDVERFRNFFKNYYKNGPKIKVKKMEYEKLQNLISWNHFFLRYYSLYRPD